MPTYPATPLADKYGDFTLTVRITIAADGSVSKVVDSPIAAIPSGPYVHGFRTAVEEAVATWQFIPAHIRRIEKGSDLDGDGVPDFVRVVASEPIAYYIDVRFDFALTHNGVAIRPAD
jgi:hypothetical protein